jgi:NADP-dependent aldehyde dehydrogenase
MSTTFHAVDPRTGTTGASFDEATPADVHTAVIAAHEVFRAGALRDGAERTAMLRGAAARLRAAGDEIVAVAEAETGLPEVRLRSELERTAGQLEAFAEVIDAGDYVEAIIDTADPDAKPISRTRPRTCCRPSCRTQIRWGSGGGSTAS